MPDSQLPERASIEYLKKLAKDRLQDLRKSDPQAKLAAALLSVARDHGFPSWRALKAEIEKRQTKNAALFFEAVTNGDVESLSALLANDPSLVHATPDGPGHGWTALHEFAKRGQADAVRLLLRYGADPNAREPGDNTYPLHWAAARGNTEIVRALLDAGGDVHGIGDVHEMDVIGWATFDWTQDDNPTSMDASRKELVSLLLERGARHHIFSAISVGDLDLIQSVVEQNPETLERRMSRFEQGLTPLHFAMRRKRYDILDLLSELGADLEATDQSAQTALEVAMLHGDREAMSRLQAAGAKQPEIIEGSAGPGFGASMANMADSIKKSVAMIQVSDVARTLDWYTSIGFKEIARYGEGGEINFGMVSFGKAEIMLNMYGKPGANAVSLWFYTDKVDPLYRLLKSRQLQSAQAALAGRPGDQEGIEFEEDINNTFYGARQFGIRDPNGYVLYFIQHLNG